MLWRHVTFTCVISGDERHKHITKIGDHMQFATVIENNMPTSSQAMILRGGDAGHRTHIVYKTVPFTSGKKGLPEVKYQKHSPRDNCELVKFDISVSTTPEHSVNGFEGVFAFDKKTQRYRWQIFSVSPKTHCTTERNQDHDGGDFAGNLNEDVLTNEVEQCDTKMTDSESFINEQSYEHTRHFTTPTVSLLDNSNLAVNPKTGLQGKRPILTSLNIPHDTEDLDETSYRRLEELGFRRRTAYSPGGSLVRIQCGESPLKSPQKCSSLPLASSDAKTKLTINNMDPTSVPKPPAIPYKNQGFQPTPFVSGGSMRKRIRPRKQKSLLDEVKECVNWDKRVTPPSHLGERHNRHMPTTACFSLRNSANYSHKDIKELVEQQTKCKIKSIQYDAVSVRMPNYGTLDRWILTFTTKSGCDMFIQLGLTVDGDKIVVKAWDDIMKDEFMPEGPARAGWDYPCSYRLQSEKHNLVLRNFLSVQC